MRPLAVLTRVESALLLREPAAVLFTLALPLVLLTLNGAQGNAPDPDLGGAGVIDALVPGYLVYVMATSAIMGMAETLADYRDRGVLRRMRISPLRPWQILGSHALTHLAMSAVGAVVLVAVAATAFDLRLPASWAATSTALLLAAASTVATGFLLAAVLPTVRTTQAVAAVLYFPAIFVSGALFPREALPEFAQRIGDVLPMTYAVRALREAWTDGVVDWPALGILASVTVVATPVAVRVFRWESN
ncbi:ABC transporter permease [Pseudonocardia humida]|uniref:Transport permease protein n=1 Tax=Pseudonocardia humida TaxID=2800819 RepID=A0ABT1A325_9PSEU|nr:ABC transporter permease [Pseudonocardia humida]MCO1657320.1 ABC transporter permease [Pseudonocardia humida]